MSEWRIPKEWGKIAMDARPKIRYWIPGAAVDDADLIRELRGLRDRGFGGVEVVPLMATPEEIIRSEDGWGTPHWNHVLSLIDETLREMGMTMDVANGPQWPISMPGITGADDPAALYELTWGVLDIGPGGRYEGSLPERRVKREEGLSRILHVFAYLQNADGALVRDSYHDLRGCLKRQGDPASGKAAETSLLSQVYYAALPCRLDVTLPEAPEGSTWLLFTFYEQPAAQKTAEGTYYVIDHLSPAGAAACEKYWAPLLKELNGLPAMESIFCDSLEYNVSLDWSRGFEEEFERRRGYSILPYLPFIGYRGTYPESDAPGYHLDCPEISEMVGQDYLETLTQCHCEYHLQKLEEMAQRCGKTIRCQTAYNKPFEEERCPLYVSVPENEALGRPSMDGLKTMAAAVQLGRKKRYSFECASEFGNGYGQDYEDLFWWVKRSLMSGMNAQVLHGGSYSGGYHGACSENGKMKGVFWPGYEAFLGVVSNNWNRTLSEENSAGCMDTIARMNTIFRKQALVDCAVYRTSYRNDGAESEFCYWDDDGRLSNAGYSYETISAALLAHPNAVVRDGLLDPEGAAWQCLLIPPQDSASLQLLEQVQRLLAEGFPVLWFGEKPARAQYYAEYRTPERKAHWQRLMDRVWEAPGLIRGASIQDAPELLKERGIRPRAELGGGMDLMTAVRADEGQGVRYYAFYGYNRVVYAPGEPHSEEMAVSAMYRQGTTKSSYRRPGRGSRRRIPTSLDAVGTVYLLNPWSGRERELEFTARDGRMEGSIEIEEDEMVLLAVREGEAPKAGREAADENAEFEMEAEIPVRFDSLTLFEFRPDTEEETSFLRSSFAPESRTIAPVELRPWHELDPDLETFVGKGIYRGTLELKKEEGQRYILCLGDVCDTFTVTVNELRTEFPDQVLKETEITKELQDGVNTLEVCVVSNLYNRVRKGNCIPGTQIPLPYAPKPYGIHESAGKKCCIRVL